MNPTSLPLLTSRKVVCETPAYSGLTFPAGKWSLREARVPTRGHFVSPQLELMRPQAIQEGYTSCLWRMSPVCQV